MLKCYSCLKNLSRIFVIVIPTINAHIDVIIDGVSISSGFVDSWFARIVATVVGINRNAAEFITTNKTILLLGVDLPIFSFESFFIASIPIGVAAFDKPNKFDVILRQIGSIASLFLFNPLNIRQSIGVKSFEQVFDKPDFSAIFINPFHKQNVPKSEKHKSTAVFPLVIIPLESSFSVPLNTEVITEKNIIAIHI